MPHRFQAARLAALAAALLACSTTRGEVFNLDTTDGPLWERPHASGMGSTFELVPYFALPFAVSATGTYTITATPQTPIYDLVQFLYDSTFDPGTPFVGYLTGDDTFSTGDPEQFQFPLTVGATYYAVTTGVAFIDYGPYALSIAGPGGVTVIEPSEFVPGDFTENHAVDADDLTAWKDGFDDPRPASHSQGDADGDFDVDGHDFLIWQRDLGRPDAIFASAAAIPEPCAAHLIVAAALIASSRFRGRQAVANLRRESRIP